MYKVSTVIPLDRLKTRQIEGQFNIFLNISQICYIQQRLTDLSSKTFYCIKNSFPQNYQWVSLHLELQSIIYTNFIITFIQLSLIRTFDLVPKASQ